MSWSRRATILAALAAATGCGFSPALAPGGDAADLRGKIAFVAPRNVLGFEMTRRLEERLGLPASPEYELRLTLTQGTQITGIPANRVTSRVTVTVHADYRLIRTATGEVVHTGQVHNFTAFTSTSNTAATRAAQVDAQRRLMAILADMLVADLLATAGTWAA